MKNTTALKAFLLGSAFAIPSVNASSYSAVDLTDVNFVSTVQTQKYVLEQIILDFDTTPETIISCAKIAKTLYSERTDRKRKNLEYLLVEIFAAVVRANPTIYGPLIRFFENTDAVYNVFLLKTNYLSLTNESLTELATIEGAKRFLTNTLSNIPVILQKINLPSDDLLVLNESVNKLKDHIGFMSVILSGSYNMYANLQHLDIHKEFKSIQHQAVIIEDNIKDSMFCCIFRRGTANSHA